MMKSSTLILVTFAGLSSFAWHQARCQDPAGTLRGIVRAADMRTALPSAAVSIKGTKLGTMTDSTGSFSMAGVPEGTYTVIVHLLGYEDWSSEEIKITAGKTTSLTVTLRESAIRVGEIQVTADRQRRLDDVRTSVLEVRPYRAKTMPGVAEDVMRTLQALPGVVAPNDFTSQLVVRGSGPDQNLIIMDDIEILNPYRLYGMISMFNPETVSDINLITGGFPAKYGDRLSAVLDVSNREGDRTVPVGGSVNASITNANVVLNGRAPAGIQGSYLFSARRTYYDLILGPIAKRSGLVSGDVAFPHFTDFQGKVVLDLDEENKLIANALFSSDGVGIISGPDRNTPDSIGILDETHNDVAGIAWHAMPSAQLYSKFGVSWYRNRGDTQFGGDLLDPSLNRDQFQAGNDTAGVRLFNVSLSSRYVFRKVSLSEDLTWLVGGHAVEAGAGYDLLMTSILWHFQPDPAFQAVLRGRNVPLVMDFVESQDYSRANVFVQDRVRLFDRLLVQPGLRLDYFQIIRTPYLEPRLNVTYLLDPLTSLRAAWGVYEQPPGYEQIFDQNAFFDLRNTAGLSAEQALHYVVGIDRWITNEWQFRTEAYYKKFSDMIVDERVPGFVYATSPVPGEDPRTLAGWTAPATAIGDSLTVNPVNGATGRSYGIEFMLEKRNTDPDSRLSGWISYALARADYVVRGVEMPFRYDQRHTVNVVLDYRVSSWLEAGVRWKYGSNFPYTAPIGITPRIIEVTHNGTVTPVIETDEKGNVVFDVNRGGDANMFQARLPAYHRLDVRLTAFAAFWGMQWSFYLDVINVYNHQNVLNYQYFIRDDLTIGRNTVSMLPIIPTLGLSARF